MPWPLCQLCESTERAGSALAAEFVDSDQLGASEWREPCQYDAVTCMFAIHYFFVSPAALHRFMENVSINLKEGEDAFVEVCLLTSFFPCMTRSCIAGLSNQPCHRGGFIGTQLPGSLYC